MFSIFRAAEKRAYDRGFMEGYKAGRRTCGETHDENMERSRREHGEAIARRDRLNTPWPDHGKHNPALRMPTPGTKIEGV